MSFIILIKLYTQIKRNHYYYYKQHKILILIYAEIIQLKKYNYEKKQEKTEKNTESLIGLILQSNIQVTSEILARAMRKENAAVATATRKGKLDTIEEDFYNDHWVFVKESLRSVVKSNLEQILIVSREALPKSLLGLGAYYSWDLDSLPEF